MWEVLIGFLRPFRGLRYFLYISTAPLCCPKVAPDGDDDDDGGGDDDDGERARATVSESQRELDKVKKMKREKEWLI